MEPDLKAVADEVARKLLGRPGVVAVGIEATPAGERVTVHLADDAARDGLPLQVAGHPLRYRTTGSIEPF